MYDEAQAGIAVRSVQHGLDRLGIVAVAPDIETQIFLGPASKRMAHSNADYRIFTPGGDKDRSDTPERAACLIVGYDGGARATRQPQAQPDQIDSQFVQRADKKEQTCEQQEFVFDKRIPLRRRE
ncbi:hypothetical protein GCM10011515_18640 [Tsuneonella deserti]|uniref:Uncharacterized protein n=1 Tax=Tsuneonella deserti TaxID=2035528 RepID=A0ABQ1SAM5_9SPHN|nr:hypothetical protein GCM10011515_18640 [Tsuneonella deserti]